MQFVDLGAQFRALEKEVRAAIDRVLEHRQFIMGPEVHQLEQELAEYCGVAHAVSTASGTDALFMALMAYEICPGDAVIVPAFTFAATAEVIQLLRAEPVFVDVEETSFNLDPQHLADTIARLRRRNKQNLRGVIAVDLFGLPADYAAIAAIAAEHELFLLADAAQSFGGVRDGQRAGAFGDLAATSFFPSKPLGGYGDGGALFTNDAAQAARLRSIREHGQGRDRYEHIRLGVTGRLDTMQAAIISCKLRILDDELAARTRIAARYEKELADCVTTPRIPAAARSAWAQYTIRCEGREAMRARLTAAGIPTAVHYPRALHQQPAYRRSGRNIGLPVAEKLARQVLSLPVHPYLSAAEQTRVIAAVRAAAAAAGARN